MHFYYFFNCGIIIVLSFLIVLFCVPTYAITRNETEFIQLARETLSRLAEGKSNIIGVSDFLLKEKQEATDHLNRFEKLLHMKRLNHDQKIERNKNGQALSVKLNNIKTFLDKIPAHRFSDGIIERNAFNGMVSKTGEMFIKTHNTCYESELSDHLLIYRNLDLDCFSAGYCMVKEGCFFVDKHDVDGVEVCNGYKISSVHVVSVNQRHGSSDFAKFCRVDNVVTIPAIWLQKPILKFYKGDDFVIASTTDTGFRSWFRIKDGSYEYIRVAEYKYICNTSFYNKHGAVVNGINVFASYSGACNYIPYNITHDVCDNIFDDRVCPDDIKFNTRFVIEHLIPIRTNESEIITYMSIGVDYWYTKFFDVFIHNGLFDNMLKLVYSYWIKFLSSDELTVRFNNVTDYFFSKFETNTTFLYTSQKGAYGNIISDALFFLIKPFVDAFREMLELFVEFLLVVLLDVVKLLKVFVDVLEGKLESFIEIVVKVIVMLGQLLYEIIMKLEKEFYVFEYAVVYMIIRFFVFESSDIASLVLLIVLIIFFGIKRKFPSVFIIMNNYYLSSNLTNYYYDYNISTFNYSSYFESDWLSSNVSLINTTHCNITSKFLTFETYNIVNCLEVIPEFKFSHIVRYNASHCIVNATLGGVSFSNFLNC